VYEPVAYRAATLFFCISALANVDPMYQWSMQFYTSLFTNSVKKTPKPTLPPSMAQMKPAKKEVERQKLRILALMNVLTKNLYSNICRSLFERHKLLFSFLLATDILKSNMSMTNPQYVDPNHLRFFLVGNTSLELNKPNPTTSNKNNTDNKDITFLTDVVWGELLSLSNLSSFESFDDLVVQNLSLFQKIVDDVNPLQLINSFLFKEEIKLKKKRVKCSKIQ